MAKDTRYAQLIESIFMSHYTEGVLTRFYVRPC